MWKYKTPGIPDDYFLREPDVPITKEEIRSVIISKARLCQGDIVYDIGCGSGSISVEAALQITSLGKLYSIDLDPAAIQLTKKNLEKFNVSNTTLISGNAKDIITTLPMCNRIFIGGASYDIKHIIELCYNKLDADGRIVISTILIETMFTVLKTIEKLFKYFDMTQITISKNRKTSTGMMMLARNPVTIISATK